MTGPEDQLRAALHAAAERSTARPPSAQQLLREHRRHTHRRNAAVGASLAAVGVGAWGVSDLMAANDAVGGDTAQIRPAHTTSPSPQATPNAACTGERFGVTDSPASPSPSPSPSTAAQLATAASQRAQAVYRAMQHPTAASTREHDALARISVPDPAPGFPVVRGNDTVMSQFSGRRLAWTRTILLAVKLGTSKTVAPGVIDTKPNGQEASIIVACHGAFPTTTAGVQAAHEYSVIGTTTARGQTATIVRSDEHQIGVLVTYDGFDIGAYGDYSTVPNDPVTPDQLVTLIDALQHLHR